MRRATTRRTAASADADAAAVDGRAATRRFFAWFHFFDPHAQYVPHEGAPDFTRQRPVRAARALYDRRSGTRTSTSAACSTTSRRSRGREDTAIVMTADHGEAFDEHGMSWHGAEIWE